MPSLRHFFAFSVMSLGVAVVVISFSLALVWHPRVWGWSLRNPRALWPIILTAMANVQLENTAMSRRRFALVNNCAGSTVRMVAFTFFRRGVRSSVFGLAWIALIFLFDNGEIQAQSPKENLLAVAGENWQAAEGVNQNVTLRVKETEFGKEGESTEHFIVDRLDGMWVTARMPGDEGTATIREWGRNDRYAFAVERNDADDDWQLAFFGSLGEPEGAEGEPPSSVKTLYSVYDVPLTVLIQSPACVIEKFDHPTDPDKNAVVRLVCQSGAAASGQLSRLREATVELSPARGWAIAGYEARIGRPDSERSKWSTVTVKNTFRSESPAGGKADLEQSDYRLAYRRQGRQETKRWLIEIKLRGECQRPRADFYLASYGITVEADERRFPAAYATITTGLVLGLLLVWFGRRLMVHRA